MEKQPKGLTELIELISRTPASELSLKVREGTAYYEDDGTAITKREIIGIFKGHRIYAKYLPYRNTYYFPRIGGYYICGDAVKGFVEILEKKLYELKYEMDERKIAEILNGGKKKTKNGQRNKTSSKSSFKKGN